MYKLNADSGTIFFAEEPEQALRGLFGPKPTPVPLEQLADFLRDHKIRKLPVSSTVYEELVAVDSAFEELLCPAKGPVAAYMGGLIQNVRCCSRVQAFGSCIVVTAA